MHPHILLRNKPLLQKSFLYILTSAVPMEHETLKSGRDVMGRDVTGRDDGRRWKDRREGWNIYVDNSLKSVSQYYELSL